MKTTMQMIDELSELIDRLKRERPDLFVKHNPFLTVKDLNEALMKVAEVVAESLKPIIIAFEQFELLPPPTRRQRFFNFIRSLIWR